MNDLQCLQRIFREVLDEPGLELRPEYAVTDNPNWDSVAMVQIVLAIEEERSIRFRTEDVATVKTVGDLLRLMEHSRA
jgi:acyl carrier protein